MASYHYSGPGTGLFFAQAGGGLKSRMIEHRQSRFMLANPDGSATTYYGTGLTWDQDSGNFTGGTVSRIVHRTISDKIIDELSGFSITIAELTTLLRHAGQTAGQLALRDTLLVRADTISGSGGNDDLTGGGGNDNLAGRNGDDVLNGNAGNDQLSGGRGADTLIGGAGSDTVSYADSEQGVRIDLESGDGHGGRAEGDTLRSIENLTGSSLNDRLMGNSGANLLDGGAGDDIIIGGDGDDELIGGSGADRLNGGAGKDWARYHDSAQGVAIDLDAQTAAQGDAAGDQLISIENLEGSKFYDLLRGDDGANILLGKGGDDALHGRGGNDQINGGKGNDFLTGGDGKDILLGGNGNDLIDAGAGRDVIKGGAGNDTIYGGMNPDVIVYDFAWSEITANYDATDFSIWVVAPDGTDHVFAALTVATDTGTYRYDVPTATWVYKSTMTGNDWLLG